MRISGWLYAVLLIAALGCHLSAAFAADYAVVTGSQSGSGMAYLLSVNGSTASVIDSLSIGSGLRGAASYGDRAFVADHDADRLQVLQVTSGGGGMQLQSLTPSGVATGAAPNDVAVGPQYAYVANSGEATIAYVNRDSLAYTTSNKVSTGMSSQCVTAYGNGVLVAAQNSVGAGRIGQITGTAWQVVHSGSDYGIPRQTTVGWIDAVAHGYTAVQSAGEVENNGGVAVFDPATGVVNTFVTAGFIPTGVWVVGSGSSWSLAVAGYSSSNNSVGQLRRYALDATGAISGAGPLATYLIGGGTFPATTHLLSGSASGRYLFATSSDGSTLADVFDVSGTSWASIGSLTASGFTGWGVTSISPQQQEVPEPSSLAAVCSGLAGVVGVLRRRRRHTDC